jgi:hypothetical protein
MAEHMLQCVHHPEKTYFSPQRAHAKRICYDDPSKEFDG